MIRQKKRDYEVLEAMNVRIKKSVSKFALVIGGFVISGLVIEFILWIISFVVVSNYQHNMLPSHVSKGEYRILCLGESTTAPPYYNDFHGDKVQSYPEILQKKLDLLKPNYFKVYNGGWPGIDSSFILMMMDELLETTSPDLVITMVGINDTELFTSFFDKTFSSKVERAISRVRLARLLKSIMIKTLFFIDSGDMYSLSNLRKKGVALDISKDSKKKEFSQIMEMIDQNLRGKSFSWNQLNKIYELGSFSLRDLNKREIIFETTIPILKKNSQFMVQAITDYLYPFYTARGKKKKLLSLLTGNISAILLLKQIEDHVRSINNRSEYFNPPMTKATKANYSRIVSKLLDMNIKVIAQQYPLLPLQWLQEGLNRYDQRISFVENKKNFEEGIEQKGLTEIFVDLFAVDFGHCTTKGNELIALNLLGPIQSLSGVSFDL